MKPVSLPKQAKRTRAWFNLPERLAQLESQPQHLIEEARQRGVAAMARIEAGVGRVVSVADAARRLNRSSATIRRQVKKGRLIGYHSVSGRHLLVLPLWQFSRKNKVHSWVPELVEGYGSNGIALANFVCAPRLSRSGTNYLQLLRSGREDEVVKMARRSNPH